MSGVKPLIPQDAFIVWTQTAWLFFFYLNQRKPEKKLISEIAGSGLWRRVSLIEIYRWFLVERTVAILTTEEPWNVGKFAYQFTRHIWEDGSLQRNIRDEETNIQAITITVLWN